MIPLTRLETWHNEFVCFVRATAADGAIGWGQTSTYNADITAQVFHRQIAPWALGQDGADIPALIDRIERAEHKFPGSYRNRAMAGLDTALWDMAGRRAGLPVAALIGGSAGPVPAYASSMRRDLTPAVEAERLKRLCAQHGYTAAKFRIGAEMGNNTDQWPGRTEDAIATIPPALPGITLLVDANSGFDTPRAIEVGQRLWDAGVTHYEEPVLWWDRAALGAVADAVEIPVAAGEQEFDPATLAALPVDILQPDVMYLGGLSKTLDSIAGARGPVVPHAANLGLVTLVTAHLLRARPGGLLEFSIEGDDYYPWQRDLFLGDPFAITEGAMRVTDTPGWGVEINPAWLDTATYRASALGDAPVSDYARLYAATMAEGLDKRA